MSIDFKSLKTQNLLNLASKPKEMVFEKVNKLESQVKEDLQSIFLNFCSCLDSVLNDIPESANLIIESKNLNKLKEDAYKKKKIIIANLTSFVESIKKKGEIKSNKSLSKVRKLTKDCVDMEINFIDKFKSEKAKMEQTVYEAKRANEQKKSEIREIDTKIKSSCRVIAGEKLKMSRETFSHPGGIALTLVVSAIAITLVVKASLVFEQFMLNGHLLQLGM